jgi:hypothetical protein
VTRSGLYRFLWLGFSGVPTLGEDPRTRDGAASPHFLDGCSAPRVVARCAKCLGADGHRRFDLLRRFKLRLRCFECDPADRGPDGRRRRHHRKPHRVSDRSQPLSPGLLFCAAHGAERGRARPDRRISRSRRIRGCGGRKQPASAGANHKPQLHRRSLWHHTSRVCWCQHLLRSRRAVHSGCMWLVSSADQRRPACRCRHWSTGPLLLNNRRWNHPARIRRRASRGALSTFSGARRHAVPQQQLYDRGAEQRRFPRKHLALGEPKLGAGCVRRQLRGRRRSAPLRQRVEQRRRRRWRHTLGATCLGCFERHVDPEPQRLIQLPRTAQLLRPRQLRI